MFLYIYYFACVLVYLYGKFLEVGLLVERIYTFKIVKNIAKLFPLEKKGLPIHILNHNGKKHDTFQKACT